MRGRGDEGCLNTSWASMCGSKGRYFLGVLLLQKWTQRGKQDDERSEEVKWLYYVPKALEVCRSWSGGAEISQAG